MVSWLWNFHKCQQVLASSIIWSKLWAGLFWPWLTSHVIIWVWFVMKNIKITCEIQEKQIKANSLTHASSLTHFASSQTIANSQTCIGPALYVQYTKNQAVKKWLPFKLIRHYIILNNVILKLNFSIFLWSEGYITQYTS